MSREQPVEPAPDPRRAALQAVLNDIRTSTEGLRYETIEQVIAALAAPIEVLVPRPEPLNALVHQGVAVAESPEALIDDLWKPVVHTDPAKKLAAMWLGYHYRDAHSLDEVETLCWEILRPAGEGSDEKRESGVEPRPQDRQEGA